MEHVVVTSQPASPIRSAFGGQSEFKSRPTIADRSASLSVSVAISDRVAAKSLGNRSRPVEDFRGWLLVEAGFDGGAEPLEHGAFLQAAGF
jgi:hypothetical protein